MLLQTNSYVVPKEKRQEHERLIRKIRQALLRIGCDQFEVYEQVGTNWSPIRGESGRFIQIMRFHDRQQHHEIQEAEKNDPSLQRLINDFMQLIDLPGQQADGQFASGHYSLTAATQPHELARMNPGPAPMSAQPPPGEPPPEDIGLARDLEVDHDEAGGNSKPAQHEESEF